MGFLDDRLNSYGDDRIDRLPRATELGELNFGGLTEKVRVCFSVARALNLEDESALPRELPEQARNQLDSLGILIGMVESFTLAQDQAATQHRDHTNRAEELRNWWTSSARPHVRARELDVNERLSESAGLIHQLRTVSNEATEIISRLRVAAGTAGAAELSAHYAEQEESHRKAERWFLGASAVAAVALSILAVILFSGLHVDLKAETGTQWAELTRNMVVRIFFLSLGGAVIAFCVRGYRSNAHLRIASGQKRTALNTYRLFLEAVSTDEARDVVTAELVRTVFAQTDSGFIADSNDRTIIDGQSSSMMNILLAARQGAKP